MQFLLLCCFNEAKWSALAEFERDGIMAKYGAWVEELKKGGRLRGGAKLDACAKAATGELRHKQYYWLETNVLVTRFLHPDGIAEVEDYMPVGPGAGPDAQLVRRVRVVRGRLPLEVECRPAFDYARAQHATAVSERGARFDSPGLSLGLAASVPLRPDGGGAVAAFPLGEGQSATFVLRIIQPEAHPGRCPGTEEAADWFRETVDYWQRWAARCTYRGRWREVVLRSALALKLLT
jgi:GH15 family glucan-1,4-alpha-glucosidase